MIAIRHDTHVYIKTELCVGLTFLMEPWNRENMELRLMKGMVRLFDTNYMTFCSTFYGMVS